MRGKSPESDFEAFEVCGDMVGVPSALKYTPSALAREIGSERPTDASMRQLTVKSSLDAMQVSVNAAIQRDVFLDKKNAIKYFLHFAIWTAVPAEEVDLCPRISPRVAK